MRLINLRPLLIVGALVGGALLLVVNVRVVLGLGESLETPSPAPSALGPSLSATGPVRADARAQVVAGDMVAVRDNPTDGPHLRTATRPAVPPPPSLSEPTPPLPALSAPGDGLSNDADADAIRKACTDGVEQARKLAAVLPADDPSRYFAERNLQQAQMEAGNGEFDECQEWAERAVDEVKEHRHTLAPGEKLKILRPDE